MGNGSSNPQEFEYSAGGRTDRLAVLAVPEALTTDTAPKFEPLISDPKMQAILIKRWQECVICVESGAPLAATVMMGGLLEGLLLAKINQLPNIIRLPSSTLLPALRTLKLAKHFS